MRVMVDRATPLASWLAGLRDDWRELRDHECTPLALVQQWSDVPRGQSLFNTLVVYEHQTLDAMMRARGGAWADRHVQYHGQTNVDVTLTAYGGRTLHLRLGYYRDRLGTEAARRMLGHLRTLLESMPSRAATPIGDIPFQADADRVATLALSNDTSVDYDQPEHLLAAFEAYAARQPDATALSFRGETTSYGDLDRTANRLAHVLRARGVTPGQRVAVCLDRSSDLLLALYGVLKAGCAYVPVDPDYPADRVAFMLADAEPALVIVDRLDRLSAAGPTAKAFVFDRDRAELTGVPPTRPDIATDPGQPAYMIYTSGSTGRPKGAPNSHRGIVNRLWWMQHEYRLTPADAVLQKTPFSFDVSVWELFWPLMVGARLVIAEPGGHRDPQYLIRTISAERITVVHFVPSMLRVFLSAPEVDRCGSLREVICSGEALPPDLVDRCHAALPATVRNLYGPTEAAVDVTHWTCPRGGLTTRVPIGRPVANTRCYILDDRLAPVPRGVPGELYIGGVQVGLGYHHRPDLTAERFLPDPFSSRPGARLYRTGDLCRHLEDGAIEYLGRLDHQVKIRGFRIELGEIEAALSALPTVHEAVVMAREDEPGDTRIVAYVVARGVGTDLVDVWRGALAATLPDYMVPQHFVVLAELPLSPNGKVDRKQLPRPAVDRGPAAAFVAPSSGLEGQIAAIWGDVLGLSHVGVRDNFFEVGGQSLKLMQVHHQLRARLEIDIPIVTLFQHPTVASLAAVLAARGAGGPAAPVVDAAVTDRAARQRAAAARMKAALGKGR
jgi:amino acid adenylation domain-containing protein